ncbi:flavin reductase family protein [Sphingobacterium kitahiroshimense]|uniref:flavin reductase family protein n=1 Tax=Sphingobacterium kitahiroshimense TaxID=470446 RepID=UPI003208DB33
MITIKRKQIDEMEKFYRISLVNSLIGFKPVNLLGSCNIDGSPNLSIISSAFHLGANPPLIGLVMRPQREHNDTLKNIQATGQYTLNNVLPDWYKQAHQTSASYGSGVSEFEKCNFKELYTDGFKAPFVRESTVRIGLELREIMDVPLNGSTIVIGEIVQILLDDLIIEEDGTVDHVKAGSMAVAGLDRYFIPEFLGRLSYAKPGIKVEEINK